MLDDKNLDAANAVTAQFWNSPLDALFTRPEVAHIRRCSVAKLEREAWLGTGIRIIKDNGRALYRKRDVLDYLGIGSATGAA